MTTNPLWTFATTCVLLVQVSFLVRPAHAAIVDFEDLSLASESFWDGPDLAGTDEAGPFGTTIKVGSYTSGGVKFTNKYNVDWVAWTGFAYSNVTDNTTPGFGSQHNAITGSGRGPGNDNYGIGYGYLDLQSNDFQNFDFDPNNPAHLLQLPHFELPAGSQIKSLHVTNTSYGALQMRDGDTFGIAKKFGGADGNDADWLKLTAYGTDAAGQPLGTSVEFYLADFRFSNNQQDYILDQWAAMDLTPLAAARRIYFNVSSSDTGINGMNTPANYAIDDIELTAAVPEPSSLGLLMVGIALAGAGLAMRRARHFGANA